MSYLHYNDVLFLLETTLLFWFGKQYTATLLQAHDYYENFNDNYEKRVRIFQITLFFNVHVLKNLNNNIRFSNIKCHAAPLPNLFCHSTYLDTHACM